MRPRERSTVSILTLLLNYDWRTQQRIRVAPERLSLLFSVRRTVDQERNATGHSESTTKRGMERKQHPASAGTGHPALNEMPG